MKIIEFFTTLLFMLLPSLAYTYSIQSHHSKVRLMNVDSGYAKVEFENMKEVGDCSEQNYYVFDFKDEINQQAYSTLLSAQASNQTAFLLLNGCHFTTPD